MYCLDTDSIVEFLRGNRKVTAKVEKNIGNLFITEISIFELYYGAYISSDIGKSISSLKALLKHLQVLKFDDKVFDQFGKNKAELKKEGKMLDNFDLIIGCTAMACNKTLVTNNAKHFDRIKGLKTENWMA